MEVILRSKGQRSKLPGTNMQKMFCAHICEKTADDLHQTDPRLIQQVSSAGHISLCSHGALPCARCYGSRAWHFLYV